MTRSDGLILDDVYAYLLSYEFRMEQNNAKLHIGGQVPQPTSHGVIKATEAASTTTRIITKVGEDAVVIMATRIGEATTTSVREAVAHDQFVKSAGKVDI